MSDLLCIIGDIMEWGREKGINNPRVQLRKVCEEALETQEALTLNVQESLVSYANPEHEYGDKSAEEHLLEEVGDIGVVWLLLCQALGIAPEDALEAAHGKNKARVGKTIDGNFIKQEDYIRGVQNQE